MPEARKVNRLAWAGEVATLILDEAGGNKSQFARLVGLKSVKTVDRWIKCEVDVSEANVLMVARAFHLDAWELLIKVGLADRAPYNPQVGERPDVDVRAVEVIEAADLPPYLKRQLLDHLEAQRAEDERRRLTEIERMIDLATGRERTA